MIIHTFNKIKSKLFSFYFVIALSMALLILMLSCFKIINIHADTTSIGLIGETSIGENFDDSSIIVVMNQDYSSPNRIYDKLFFDEEEIESIIDLTEIPLEKVDDVLHKKPNFKQILKINLKFKDKEKVLSIIERLNKKEGVLAAEPNYYGSGDALPANYSGSRYSSLWGLHDFDGGIRAENSWNYTTGSASLKVAVIDTGVFAHLNLSANMGLGYNFVDNNTNTNDTDGHGTHIAGIIGANQNTTNGTVGINWNVTIIPLKISNTLTNWDTSRVIQAITWADNNDIPVINFSGNDFGPDALKNAISNYDGLFVCSAGNDSSNNDLTPNYPSDYSQGQDFSDRVISVGAYELVGGSGISSISRCNFSNFGNQSVSIFAPGSSILSTVPTTVDSSGYMYKSGTSMAAPYVTGVAALMLSINPNLTPQQIKATIMNNATQSTTLSGLCVCGGRLDAYKSVAAVALDTDTIGSNIKINSFITGYIPPLNMDLTIPNSFAQISSAYGSSQQNVQIIGSSAFSNYSSIISLELPNTITNIDSYAFQNCSGIQNLNFGINPSLTNIGVGAFKGCSSLSNIEIPALVQHIDSDAFQNCTSLEDVNVLKEEAPLINLGTNVFDNCHNNLTITVPVNRLCDYKTKTNWSSYANKIVPNSTLDSIELECTMTSTNLNISIFSNYNKLYELNVDCGKSYKFSATSTYLVTFIIYNSNMEVVASNNTDNELASFLSPGIYYLDIRYTSISDSGSIVLNYGLTYSSNDELFYGSNNILSRVHSISNNQKHGYFYYEHTLSEGFYKFSVDAVSNNVTYPINTIKIYTDASKTALLDRYPLTNSITAHSMTNENTLYIYIPESGTYYIDVLLTSYNYSAITFTISELDNNDFDFSSNFLYPAYSELFTSSKYSYFEEIDVSHRTSWQLSVVTDGNITTNINIYLFKKEIDEIEPGEIHYSCQLLSNYQISALDSGPLIPFILDSGTYYLGYSSNTNNIDISFALLRIINQNINMTSTLVTDPALNQGFTLGSEVLFNNGALLGNTITEGFSRCIYLMVEDRLLEPMSRLDYDWYSSNDEVASVSSYGTVLGKTVNVDTNVVIYAVLKTDPSIIYYKSFTILNDLSNSEIDIDDYQSYSYSLENGTYQIDLNSSNSPYPMISYYSWTLLVPSMYPNLSVSMDAWGHVTSNGEGALVILGHYILNPRVYVAIYLTIGS